MLGRAKEADRWLEPVLNGITAAVPDPEANWLASRSALQQHQFDRARAELAKSGTYRAENPLVLEPSPYAGEAKCSPCHKEITRAHDQTRHARTFHHAGDLFKLPRPDGPFADPDHADVVHTLVQDGKKLKVQTKIDDRVFETLVDYAFGNDRPVLLPGRP